MKVLLAHNRYRVPGGEERHVDLLELGLRDAGVEVRRFERDSTGLDSSRRRRVTAGALLAYRPGGSGIGRVLTEWRPDVVHFHNIWPLLTPAALRAAKRAGATVVLTAHNFRFACPSGLHADCAGRSALACALHNPRGSVGESLAYGLALEVQRRLRLLDRWVDAFVAPSDIVATALCRTGFPEHKVHVIPHGLPIAPRPTEGASHGLFAGRLSKEKGIRTLIEASRIAASVPLVVAGNGPLAAEVATAAGAIRYVGRLDRPQLDDALAAAAFTVVPSECPESLSLATLESFAAGRPVVAARSGALAQLVEDGRNGLLVPPGNPRALAAAMTALWQRPALARRLGARALETAHRRFSLATQTAYVVELYSQQVAA